jgi:hypothetical protein
MNPTDREDIKKYINIPFTCSTHFSSKEEKLYESEVAQRCDTRISDIPLFTSYHLQSSTATVICMVSYIRDFQWNGPKGPRVLESFGPAA